MGNSQAFQPDWASAPGDTISEVLEDQGISVVDFAELIGQSFEEVNDLLEGRATITIGVARQLQKVIGASVEFWISRDFQYREDVSRLNAADDDWLSEVPIGDMIRFGWLRPVPRPSDELTACLRYFDVPNVRIWRETYKGLLDKMVAFRTSPSFDSRPAAVAAWLREGEIESARIDCGSWDPERFRESLLKIRSLTWLKDPSQFLPELQNICAADGVAVVIVRAPNGCRASGATRFVSRDKASLQLSFRYLTDDHFWFTFFHEAGHLLLHGETNSFQEQLRGEKSWILEGTDAPETPEEQEADKFAANILVPAEFQPELLGLPLDFRKVVRFATRIGVAPGIVVGQLQHLGRFGYDQLNSLKRRYDWND